MFSESKVTEIFFMADEFCKVYERMMSQSSLKTADLPKKRKYTQFKKTEQKKW